MKRKILVSFVVLVMAFTTMVGAQVSTDWASYYEGEGNDAVLGLAIDASSNSFVTGYTWVSDSLDNYDWITIKYDSLGEEKWTVTYSGANSSYDEARAVAVDSEGNVYVTGTVDYPLGDWATIKYDSLGVEQWVVIKDGNGNSYDQPNAITVDDDGNIYVTGFCQKEVSPSSYRDIITIKYNSDGVEQWVAAYNGPGDHWDEPVAIAVDSEFNVYVTGRSDGNETNADYATIKYNSDGVEQWVTRYNGSLIHSDTPRSLTLDPNSNLYVTGQTYSPETQQDWATVKYNSDGVEQWVVIYDGPASNSDEPSTISSDPYGNIYVSGTDIGVGESSYEYTFVTIKYDSLGEEQWLERYEGVSIGDISLNSLTCDEFGNPYIAGSEYISGTSNFDYSIMKYNAISDSQWVVTYNGPANDDDEPVSVKVNSAGKVIIAGSTVLNGDDTDWMIVMLTQLPTINGLVGGSPGHPGIIIDLLSDEGELLESRVSGIDGGYVFRGVGARTYWLEPVEPLGYRVDPSRVQLSILPDAIDTVDFVLIERLIVNDARAKSYWKHEIIAINQGIGHHDYTEVELLGFFQDIFDHFYLNPVNPIEVESVTYMNEPPVTPTTMEELAEMLTIEEGDTLYIQACQQLVALLLNVVSDKLGQYMQASEDSATISQAVVYIDQLLNVDNELALAIAETLNTAQHVAAGIIPLTTPNVIFGNELESALAVQSQPSKLSLSTPNPNPFNPITKISYYLPQADYAKIIVYDITGRQVAKLYDNWQGAGHHAIIFNGKNFASGIYFCRLTTGNGYHSQVVQMVLQK